MTADPASGQLDPAEADIPAGIPRGPWLLVVGMHRSGTSALTGACVSLGFGATQVADRMDWPESNPEHWESLSLALHDDALLHHLEGSWDAPPVLDPGWERSSAIRPVPHPGPVAAAAYPDPGPLVWKDPRVCLLLPYWKRFIPDQPVAILVWRSPMAVARSLHARDGLSLAHGLALWERYNRSALMNLAGVDTYVVEYDRVLEDAGPVLGRLADWLTALPLFTPFFRRQDGGAMTAEFSSALRHQRSDGDDDLLLGSQRRLVEMLSDLSGGHRPFVPGDVPPESGWTTALIEAQRQVWLRTRRVSTLEDEIVRMHTERTAASAAGQDGAAVARPTTASAGRIRIPDALAARVSGLRRRPTGDGERAHGASGPG